jgi:hypothetical protein
MSAEVAWTRQYPGLEEVGNGGLVVGWNLGERVLERTFDSFAGKDDFVPQF